LNNRPDYGDRQRQGGKKRRPGNRRKRSNGQRRRGRGGASKGGNGSDRRRIAVGSTELNAFELFCALYLGITPDDRFRMQRPAEVAERFGINAYQLDEKMAEYGLDRETISRSGFDMQMAKYDIRVAPEGISRRELAKPWFDELRERVLEIRPELRESAEKNEVDEKVEENPEPSSAPAELKTSLFDD